MYRNQAQQGTIVICPLHGVTRIIGGSTRVMVDGVPAARVGDATTCGAIIVTGRLPYVIDGARAAFDGDHTDHGGVIVARPATGSGAESGCDPSPQVRAATLLRSAALAGFSVVDFGSPRLSATLPHRFGGQPSRHTLVEWGQA